MTIFAQTTALPRRRFLAASLAATCTTPFAARHVFAADDAKKIPFTAASVEEKDGAFTVQWSAPSDTKTITIFSGPSPGEIKRDLMVGKGGASGTLTISLPRDPQSPRRYFELVPEVGQPLTIAPRALRLLTAPNFRDVGGYRCTDGRWVRMGLLYRSDQLNLLSDADLDALRRLNIRLVCDLRTDAERKGPGADRLPPGATPLIADVTGNNPDSALAGILNSPDKIRAAGPAKMEAEMAAVYRQLVTAQSAQEGYNAMFQRLADPIMLPGIFHCTAGKDRTGWASAIFLSIMGVPRDTIVADYLASTGFLVEKNKRLLESIADPAVRAAMEPLTGVRASYINAAFDQVKKSYGTIENYVVEGLKLTLPALKLLRRLHTVGEATPR
jgi:protein-tyrosine phosphatase